MKKSSKCVRILSMSGSKTYKIDDNKIEVLWKQFLPSDKKVLTNKAVIFFCGWSGGEKRKSVREISYFLAKFSNAPTYAIYARAKKDTDDLLFKEAEGVLRFLKEKKISEVILTGHSLGGIKAINLCYLLQTPGSKIKIKGLILFNSAGLYNEGKFSLAKISLIDTIFSTPQVIMRESFTNKDLLKTSIRADIDMLAGVFGEIKEFKFRVIKRTLRQLKETSMRNPRLTEIKVPVVLLQGKYDPISDYKKINLENSFPKSPYVKMIISERLGLHGLPLFRPRFSAKTCLNYLRIYEN